MDPFWERVRSQAMSGEGIGGEDALAVLSLGNDALWRLLDVSEAVRRRFKGDGIRLCSIVNAKSGLCSEDCSFCAQSSRSSAGIGKYPLLSGEDIFREAAA
ncbi:MAG: biotin synthase BioB, partial [Desulfobacteria bacterium]